MTVQVYVNGKCKETSVSVRVHASKFVYLKWYHVISDFILELCILMRRFMQSEGKKANATVAGTEIAFK